MKKTWVKLLAFSLGAFLASSIQAVEVEVEIEDFSYIPQQVAINVGDTVKWKNRDAVRHSTTSGENAVPNGKWNSGLLSMDQTFSLVFEEDGTYPYFCVPHPWMTGTVIVNPRPDTGDTTPLPAVEERLKAVNAQLEVRPTSLEFALPSVTNLELVVYNLTGQMQIVLARGIYKEGRYEIPRPRFIPGVYFVRLSTDESVITRKLVQMQ